MTPTERFADDEPTAMTESVFSRVVVGVDGTEPGFEACRQAARLADAGAPIEAVAVVHLAEAAPGGVRGAPIADELAREAEAALDKAVADPRRARTPALRERVRDRSAARRDRASRCDADRSSARTDIGASRRS